jgi:hypothetical protein
MKSKLKILLLLSPVVLNCSTEPHFTNTPQITFKGFNKYLLSAGNGVGKAKRDSLIITIGFKDGDGDLGNDLPLTSLDSTRYIQTGGWGNYRIRTFRLENNQYKELSFSETNFLLFPQLSRKEKKGAIEGDLDLRQIYPYGTRYTLYPTKFRIQIRDRALNLSNEVETDTIHLAYSY